MKYKVGDKVVIISKPPRELPSGVARAIAWAGEMNKWCGKTMTIEKIEHGHYVMTEDAGDGCNFDGHWHWCDEFIDHAATEAFGSKTVKRYVIVEEKYGYRLGQQVDFFPAGQMFETVRPILKEVLN